VVGEQSIESYRDLRVWQESMTLAEQCYLLTREFPRSEMFSLVSQIRRAAASVPANVAEGHGRESTGSFIQSLRIAQGSLKELQTHLLLSQRVGIAGGSALDATLARSDHVGRMLRSLIRSLQSRDPG